MDGTGSTEKSFKIEWLFVRHSPWNGSSSIPTSNLHTVCHLHAVRDRLCFDLLGSIRRVLDIPDLVPAMPSAQAVQLQQPWPIGLCADFTAVSS